MTCLFLGVYNEVIFFPAQNLCYKNQNSPGLFFFFFFNTGVQIWNPKNKTKQKTLGHRNCFRVNVILIPNCMQRLG